MGVDHRAVEILIEAKVRGVRFDRTLMLGRQGRHISPAAIDAIAKAKGVDLGPEALRRIGASAYVEPLLQALGAHVVDSLDASNFEGATIVHDLNQPKRFENPYDLVMDFGVTEHVFDVKSAWENIVSAVAIGGCYLSVQMANDYVGHGFYQFSPELFYSTLEANGFDQVEVYLAATRPGPDWSLALNPRLIGRRVQARSTEPVYVLCLATRRADLGGFVVPQQSDYESDWAESVAAESAANANRPLRQSAGLALRRLGLWLLQRGASLRRQRPDGLSRAPFLIERKARTH